MPHLIETYARSTGFKIDRPWLKEDFYALPFTKYITLASGSNQGAKNYDYWQEVIGILLPILSSSGISIVLLGSPSDPALQGVHDLRGKTSYAQSYYLIKNALMHMGNDSWTAHAAGFSNVPLVALYGSTDKTLHGPLWYRGDATVLLESHRGGAKPSFTANESPKTVNYIDPLDVVRAVLRLLDIPIPVLKHTQFIGAMYANSVIEWIPNAVVDPRFNPDAPVVARMDKHHDEAILVQTLQTGRKMHLFLKKPLADPNILNAFKASFLSYSHELTIDCPIPYVRAMKAAFPKVAFFSRLPSGDELNQLRFHFIDQTMIEQAMESTREDYLRESAKYLNEPAENTLDRASHIGTLEFKTNKYVLSQGQVYLSHAHLTANRPTTGINTDKVIDTSEFWLDLHHLLVTTT